MAGGGAGGGKDERALRRLSSPGWPGWAECFLSTDSVNPATENYYYSNDLYRNEEVKQIYKIKL